MMKLGMIKSYIFLMLVAFVFSQYNVLADNIGNTVVAKVGKEEIIYKDIEKAYQKNLNRTAKPLHMLPKDSIDSFIELYINYRLKVHDAISRGLLKDESVQKDIQENRKILAEKFYYDKYIKEPNLEKITERRKKEFQVGVILIQFDRPGTNDTSKARSEIEEVIKKLNSGAEFQELAKEYSDDKTSSEKGGILDSYITAGKVQRPIEELIYNMQIGEYNKEPLKTQYGYFVIKIFDVADRFYIKPAHILLSIMGVQKQDSVKQLADSIYIAIQNGADFGELAMKYSTDPASAKAKGSLEDFYSRSTGFLRTKKNVVPEFQRTLFTLKKGEVSEPVKSSFGFHIIKNLEEMPIDIDAEMEEMKTMYNNLYFEQDKREHLDSLLESMDYKLEEGIANDVIAYSDTTKFFSSSSWHQNIEDPLKETILFTMKDTSITVESFIEMAQKEAAKNNLKVSNKGIRNMTRRLAESIAFDRVSVGMEEKSDEFRYLVNEFRDGILMFKVAAEEVWDKLKFDSTMAKEFFEKNKEKYRTSYRYDVTEIYLLDDSVTTFVMSQIEAGKDFEELAANHTMRDRYRQKKGNWGEISIKDNKLAQMVHLNEPKEGEILGPLKYQLGKSIIRVNKVLPPRQKTFEEAIPDLAPDYQDMLQEKLTNDWLNEVRKTHKVTIYEDKLENVVKKLNS